MKDNTVPSDASCVHECTYTNTSEHYFGHVKRH